MSVHPKSSLSIGRRQLLKGVAALGVASALPQSLYAASNRPKRGGTFRMGIGAGNTSDSLDPSQASNSFTQVLSGSLHAMLTEVAADGSLQPMLATEWTASADAATWTFHLRPGVSFHNGQPMRVQDVIASLNYHRDEDSKSSAKVVLEPIREMRALDERTLEIRLKAGNADLPYLLSDFRLVVMPSEDGKVKDPASGVGAGPFVLDNFEPGVKARVRRNPDYFKPEQPYFDAVEMMSITDVVARTNALVTGRIDYMDRCDLKTVDKLAQRDKLVVEETQGTQHYTIPMNSSMAPFNDANVRNALKYAIDREQLVKHILHGYGSVGNDNPLAPSKRYFNPEIPQRQYDPDKAKFFLKKAGLNSLSVPLSAAEAAFVGCIDSAVLYSEQAKAAGIDIQVVREPNDGYWSNVWMKKPWSFSYWGGGQVADQIFSVTYSSSAQWNESFMFSERFDKLLGMARAELDEPKRAEMYAEMQWIIHDQGGALIPMFASYVNAYSDQLGHGDRVGTTLDLDSFRIAERWWFTA